MRGDITPATTRISYNKLFGFESVAGLIPQSNLRLFGAGESHSYTPEGSGVSKTITPSLNGIWLVVVSFRGEGIEHSSVYLFYNLGGIYGKDIKRIYSYDYTDKSSVTASVTDGTKGFRLNANFSNPLYGGISVVCRKLNA